MKSKTYNGFDEFVTPKNIRRKTTSKGWGTKPQRKKYNNEDDAPDWYLEREERLLTLMAEKERITEELNELRDEIQKRMEVDELEQIDTDNAKVKLIAPFQRRTINAKALKEDYPNIYRKYVIVTDVPESLRVFVQKHALVDLSTFFN